MESDCFIKSSLSEKDRRIHPWYREISPSVLCCLFNLIVFYYQLITLSFTAYHSINRSGQHRSALRWGEEEGPRAVILRSHPGREQEEMEERGAGIWGLDEDPRLCGMATFNIIAVYFNTFKILQWSPGIGTAREAEVVFILRWS